MWWVVRWHTSKHFEKYSRSMIFCGLPIPRHLSPAACLLRPEVPKPSKTLTHRKETRDIPIPQLEGPSISRPLSSWGDLRVSKIAASTNFVGCFLLALSYFSLLLLSALNDLTGPSSGPLAWKTYSIPFRRWKVVEENHLKHLPPAAEREAGNLQNFFPSHACQRKKEV